MLAVVAAGTLAACSGVGEDLGRPAAAAPPTTTATSNAADGSQAGDVVTVSGTGTAEVVPDSARVTIAVEVSDAEVATAFELAATRADAVIAALSDAGVADDAIGTTSIDVRAQRERPDETSTDADVQSYVVRNAVSVTIEEVDRAGEVLAAATEAGGDATRIDGFELVVTDDADALSAARETAFSDARTSAVAYAGLADRSLGALHTLVEATGPRPPVPFESASTELADPPVVAGTVSVTVSISATWQLE